MSNPKVGTPGRAMAGRLNNTPRGGGTTGLSRLGTPASRVPKTGNENRVRVVVRVRPSLDSEACDTSAITEIFKGSDGVDILRLSDKNTSRVESYQLDACYSEQDPVSSIFTAEVEPILSSIFRGNNATVFAYGATGSGKTYTMEGSGDQPGLMSLAMESILAIAKTTKSQIEISFYEVYMDRCYDLLNFTDMELSVLEDGHGRIQLRGLAQVEVNNVEDFDTIFGEGCAFRRTGLTGLNDVSSRSHSILTITVTNSNDGTPFAELSGKLNLIDLAGSENNRRTGNDGLRLLESTAINQSLFALSKVISALNANDSRVPYRDSKLTRILQDSLGGTSRAVMVACLNSDSYQESSATLSMASKSRQVVNRLQVEYQGDAMDQNLDMEAKLKAWRESKNRTPRKPVTIYPSPLCAKSPSASKAAAPKRAVMSVPNAGKPKPRVNMVDKARKLQTGNEVHSMWPNPITFIGDKPEHCAFGTSFGKSRVEKDTGVSWTYISDKGSANTDNSQQANSVHLGPSGANKDNCSPNSQSAGDTAILAFTSPPLSERLKNLSRTTLSAYKTTLDSTTSPPLSERLKNLSLSLRALAPLPVNMPRVAEVDVTPLKCKSSTVDYALGSLERNFPERNFEAGFDHQSPLQLANCDPMTPTLGENSMLTPVSGTGTPFDRFSRTNPELQRTLAKEYLDTLNTASREELLQLRGIGPVRTERILKLREKSQEPLKEFDDLQKIGLSARQANAIFNTNAIRQVIL